MRLIVKSSGVTVTSSGRILLLEIGYEGINTEEGYVACSLYDICSIIRVRVYNCDYILLHVWMRVSRVLEELGRNMLSSSD
jgi:hypothetical protein